MRLLLDENLSRRVCAGLKAAGHDAVHVDEVGLASVDDELVLARARHEDRVLVSCDHDFVQILFASGEAGPSVVLTREIDTLRAEQISALLVAAISPGTRGAAGSGCDSDTHSGSGEGPTFAGAQGRRVASVSASDLGTDRVRNVLRRVNELLQEQAERTG